MYLIMLKLDLVSVLINYIVFCFEFKKSHDQISNCKTRVYTLEYILWFHKSSWTHAFLS